MRNHRSDYDEIDLLDSLSELYRASVRTEFSLEITSKWLSSNPCPFLMHKLRRSSFSQNKTANHTLYNISLLLPHRRVNSPRHLSIRHHHIKSLLRQRRRHTTVLTPIRRGSLLRSTGLLVYPGGDGAKPGTQILRGVCHEGVSAVISAVVAGESAAEALPLRASPDGAEVNIWFKRIRSVWSGSIGGSSSGRLNDDDVPVTKPRR